MEQPKIKMIPYLYNNGYGGFRFSYEFKEKKYKEIYGETMKMNYECKRYDEKCINV
jgi:hypothetical protein